MEVLSWYLWIVSTVLLSFWKMVILPRLLRSPTCRWLHSTPLTPLPHLQVLLTRNRWSTEAVFGRFGPIRSFGQSFTRSFSRVRGLTSSMSALRGREGGELPDLSDKHYNKVREIRTGGQEFRNFFADLLNGSPLTNLWFFSEALAIYPGFGVLPKPQPSIKAYQRD